MGAITWDPSPLLGVRRRFQPRSASRGWAARLKVSSLAPWTRSMNEPVLVTLPIFLCASGIYLTGGNLRATSNV